MHRNSGRLASRHKKRAEALPRLHRLSSSARWVSLQSIIRLRIRRTPPFAATSGSIWEAVVAHQDERPRRTAVPVTSRQTFTDAYFSTFARCASSSGFALSVTAARASGRLRFADIPLGRGSRGAGTTIEHYSDCFRRHRPKDAMGTMASVGGCADPGGCNYCPVCLEPLGAQAAGWRSPVALAGSCAGGVASRL